jgi:hypothetical protein
VLEVITSALAKSLSPNGFARSVKNAPQSTPLREGQLPSLAQGFLALPVSNRAPAREGPEQKWALQPINALAHNVD